MERIITGIGDFASDFDLPSSGAAKEQIVDMVNCDFNLEGKI